MGQQAACLHGYFEIQVLLEDARYRAGVTQSIKSGRPSRRVDMFGVLPEQESRLCTHEVVFFPTEGDSFTQLEFARVAVVVSLQLLCLALGKLAWQSLPCR